MRCVPLMEQLLPEHVMSVYRGKVSFRVAGSQSLTCTSVRVVKPRGKVQVLLGHQISTGMNLPRWSHKSQNKWHKGPPVHCQSYPRSATSPLDIMLRGLSALMTLLGSISHLCLWVNTMHTKSETHLWWLVFIRADTHLLGKKKKALCFELEILLSRKVLDCLVHDESTCAGQKWVYHYVSVPQRRMDNLCTSRGPGC